MGMKESDVIIKPSAIKGDYVISFKKEKELLGDEIEKLLKVDASLNVTDFNGLI
jgi:hypothetical protein